MRKGLASLLVVFLFSMLMTFILVLWQSRVMMFIHRNQAMSDVVRATYNAESDINDVIARFVGDYNVPGSGTRTLADGTRLTIVNNTSGDTTTLRVKAQRQYATTELELTKILTNSLSGMYNHADIIMTIDCSGSMVFKADPDCEGTCPTRLEKAREAALVFMDRVDALPPDIKAKFRIGVQAYRVTRRWFNDGANVELTSDLARVRNAISSELQTTPSNSPICTTIEDNDPDFGPEEGVTDIGAPLVFADDYFRPLQTPTRKQIQVLITDGLPNTSLEDPRCGTHDCQGEDNPSSSCWNGAINYLKCGLAPTSYQFSPGRYGLRNPDMDVFVASVIEAGNPDEPGSVEAFNQTMDIFNNPTFVTRHYNTINANDLTAFMNDIFERIATKTLEINIKKIVPTPPF